MDIRPAATVVVARPGGDGAAHPVEILALRRSTRSRFAPSFVVFPGGVVEEGDAALARAWFGDEAEWARACAVRELAEEAGLVLTSGGLVEAPGHLPGDPRLAPPPVSSLPEMARWVAPPFLPVRYDATFFAAAGPAGLTPTPDGIEVDRAWWAAPADLLAGGAGGTLALKWPTLKTLEALASCSSVEEVLALRVDQVSPPGAPTS